MLTIVTEIVVTIVGTIFVSQRLKKTSLIRLDTDAILKVLCLKLMPTVRNLGQPVSVSMG